MKTGPPTFYVLVTRAFELVANNGHVRTALEKGEQMQRLDAYIRKHLYYCVVVCLAALSAEELMRHLAALAPAKLI